MLYFSKILSASALVSALIAGPIAYAADPIGKVSALRGTSLASGTGGERTLEAGSPLFQGDTVRASGGGNVQITLNDGTRLVVGPGSRLVLQTYLQRNKSTASKVTVKALRGYFRFITGKSPKSAYTIETANATVGIRGTGFDLRVSSRTGAAVLVGAIRLRGANGQAVNAAAGCGVAEAGAGGTDARLLDGQARANRLRTDFPFIAGQGALTAPFRLPVQNCRIAQRLDGTGGSPRKPSPPPPKQRQTPGID
jgi:hypothetical protein